MAVKYDGLTREELIARLRQGDTDHCATLAKLELLEHDYADLQDYVAGKQALIQDLIEGTVTVEMIRGSKAEK